MPPPPDSGLRKRKFGSARPKTQTSSPVCRVRAGSEIAFFFKPSAGLTCYSLLFSCLLAASPIPASAWGERAHQIVNAAAVENLPDPLRSYFRARKAILVEHAIDPDLLAREKPEEHRHHFTEPEAYGRYPFSNFRKRFVDERRGPSPFEIKYGDSVWQIELFTLRLADALRKQRWDDADRAAVFAAHYACDLTQPLHTVLNYDGQFTHQGGIHARFETDLVNALRDQWALNPLPPENETNLRARIFRELLESYRARDLVFAADRIAVSGRSYLDPIYFPTFAKLAGPVALKRLEAAVSFVSSVWYTAWVGAGKPHLWSRTAARNVSDIWFGSPGRRLRPGTCGGSVPRESQANHRCRDTCADHFQPECACSLSSRTSPHPFEYSVFVVAKRRRRLRGLS